MRSRRSALSWKRGIEIISKYAHNGGWCQHGADCGRFSLTDGRKLIRRKDIEWVVNSGQYTPRPNKKVPPKPQVGYANGLAVYGPNLGMLVALEATALPAAERPGRVIATGVIEEEEMGEYGRTIRRRSTARESVENVLTILKKYFDLDCTKFDLHINFPGGIPLDGPSAGIALVTVVYSALTGKPVDNLVAMTGEVSILGTVMPVGGIIPKIKAAKEAGAKRVLIPAENWQDAFEDETGLEIVPVRRIEEVIQWAFRQEPAGEKEAVDGDARREKYIPAQSRKEELVVAAGGG